MLVNSGLKSIHDSGITIGDIYFNLPNKDICDQEIPWGCDYEDLISLPGIGDYTAKAILGIAYNKPVLPLDANIERIIFDRNGYKYHGRVKVLAEAIRSAEIII